MKVKTRAVATGWFVRLCYPFGAMPFGYCARRRISFIEGNTIHMTANLIFFVLLPIAYINSHFLLKRLKSGHHETWASLGTPKLGDSNLSTQAKALSGLLWSGKFFCLNDPQLSCMCMASMSLWLVAFIAFLFVLFV
jgi:hypothetical protein